MKKFTDYEEFEKGFPPVSASEFLTWVKDKIEGIPKESRSTATIELRTSASYAEPIVVVRIGYLQNEVSGVKTTNIPDIKPFEVECEEDWKAITEWMGQQSFHELDEAVNKRCRWTYEITDHGIWIQIVVRDNGTGEKFTVPQNPDNW